MSLLLPILALLLLLLLIGLILYKPNQSESKQVDVTTEEETDIPTELATPFQLPRVVEGGIPFYAVVDFQSTGLETKGEDATRILQVAWLILDEAYRVTNRTTIMVWQEELGSLEARRVHRITEQQLERYGVPEEQMIYQLWQTVKDVPYLVFHNAAYDLALFRASLERHLSDALPVFDEKKAICTMTFYTPESYCSLIQLSSELTRHPPQELAKVSPVAWRNVCLTRVCLIALHHLFPEEKADDHGALPITDFLFP